MSPTRENGNMVLGARVSPIVGNTNWAGILSGPAIPHWIHLYCHHHHLFQGQTSCVTF